MIDLRSLDVLRGMLAVYVVAGHARWLLWEGHSEWIKYSHSWWENVLAYASVSLRFGHEAVLIFFLFSGIFIHLRMANNIIKNKPIEIDHSNFYKGLAS